MEVKIEMIETVLLLVLLLVVYIYFSDKCNLTSRKNSVDLREVNTLS